MVRHPPISIHPSLYPSFYPFIRYSKLSVKYTCIQPYLGALSITPAHDIEDHINDESFAQLVQQSKQRYNEILEQANDDDDDDDDDNNGDGDGDDDNNNYQGKFPDHDGPKRSTDQIEDWVHTKLEGIETDEFKFLLLCFLHHYLFFLYSIHCPLTIFFTDV